MNLKYMKVSIFEISYKKKKKNVTILNLYIYIYIYIYIGTVIGTVYIGMSENGQLKLHVVIEANRTFLFWFHISTPDIIFDNILQLSV